MSQMTESPKSFTAAEAIGAYVRVKLNSSGQAAIAGVNEAGVGHTERACASGDVVAVRMHNHSGTRKMVAGGAIVLGAQVLNGASGRVDDATSGGPVCGVALEAAANAGDIIEVAPINQADQGSSLVYNNVADSAAITNTVTETDFDKNYTFPAGDLKEGDVLDIEAEVTTPSTNSTDTLNLRLKVGTEEICATGAVDVANGDVGHIKAKVIVRAAGAGGNVQGTGHTALGVPGTVTAKPFRKAGAAEDLSGAVVVKVTGQWSVANAGNQAVLEHLSIVRHRK